MKAILITKKGGPEVLVYQDVPIPLTAPGEVLIRVHTAGLNRSDIYSRSSNSYGSNGGPEIPGLEVSGIVEGLGPGVRRWKKGDAVCALVNGGGYAEYVAVPEGQCLPVPAGLSLGDAAALPETIFTVWQNVFRVGALGPGEKLLVHGGSSGIGVTAIQLASALGSPIYVTAGTDEKCRWCESIGATMAVNYKTADFEAILQDVGIDVILDMTGGDFTPKNIRLMNADGRIVMINAMRGKNATIDLSEIMRRRVVLTGGHLKPRDTAFKAALAADVEKNVWPLIAKGALRPVIHAVLPLADAAAAQRLMERSEHRGKILLSVEG